MSKTPAQIIVFAIGSDVLAEALGIKRRAVNAAGAAGKLPPAWWPIVRDMCAARGIDCPEHAFGWRQKGKEK